MQAQMPDSVPQPANVPIQDPTPSDVPPLEIPPGGDPMPTPSPIRA